MSGVMSRRPPGKRGYTRVYATPRRQDQPTEFSVIRAVVNGLCPSTHNLCGVIISPLQTVFAVVDDLLGRVSVEVRRIGYGESP